MNSSLGTVVRVVPSKRLTRAAFLAKGRRSWRGSRTRPIPRDAPFGRQRTKLPGASRVSYRRSRGMFEQRFPVGIRLSTPDRRLHSLALLPNGRGSSPSRLHNTL